jgi:hypothetical protein
MASKKKTQKTPSAAKAAQPKHAGKARKGAAAALTDATPTVEASVLGNATSAASSTTEAEKPQDPKTVATTKPLSAVAAAARVLAESGQPMSCPELIAQMAAKGYWSSPAGKTPASTLYAALLREINTKKDASRFRKTDRGKFTLS